MGGDNGGGKRDGGGGGGKQRSKRARFSKHPGSGPSSAIPQGARGLLVTCDAGRERRCGDEIAALVEGAFERLGTSEPAAAAATATAAAPEAAGGDTVDARLAAEVAALRDPRKDRFRYYDTGVRGVFFLSFPSAFREPGAPGPVAVATDLVERARREGRSGSRFAQRLVPVERTCFGGLDELAAMALEVAKEHFGAVLEEGEEKEEEKTGGDDDKAAAAAGEPEAKEEDKAAVQEEEEQEPKPEAPAGDDEQAAPAAEDKAPPPAAAAKSGEAVVLPQKPRTTAREGTTPLTFAVDVDSRACGRITRAHAIDVVAAPVPCPPHRVDLSKPDATIVVQCVRNAATAAVVPRFRELMRLNLARAAQVGAEEMAAAGGGGEEGGAAAGAAAAATAE
jgi:tRNA(Ser,Leu) C12 N-acetylase TAN1